jgi:hypothetical protein
MSEENVLTKEIAEQWVADEESVELNEFTTMEEAAAQSLLGTHGGDLSLTGLTGLSDATATSLAKHPGALYLNSLSKLSDAAAASLAKHKGNLTLDTDVLTESTDAVCASLAKHEQNISFVWYEFQELPRNPGSGFIDLLKMVAASAASEYQTLGFPCTELSDPMAQALAEVEAPLNLFSLETLESVPLARKLASQDSVELMALTVLSPELALDLAFCQGALHLGADESSWDDANLQELSPVAAENLARHSGELVLGISSISPASAETLALHTGSLTLVGLSELSAESAAALAMYRGDLKVVTFGPENIAMQLLNKEAGGLSIWWDLGIREEGDAGTLNQEIATAICQFKGDSLELNFSVLDSAAAEIISTTEFALSLPVLREIDIEVAEALQSHAGTLRLGGLEGFEISDEAASQLVQHVGALELPEYGLAESAQAILNQHHSIVVDSDPYDDDDDAFAFVWQKDD